MQAHRAGGAVWLAVIIFTMLALGVAVPSASAAGPFLKSSPANRAHRQELRPDAKGPAFSFVGALPQSLGMAPEPMAPPAQPAPSQTARMMSAELPSSYDLRALGRVTPVRDQYPFGACWTFGSLASLESCLLPTERRDFSEDHMILRSGFDDGGDPYNRGGNYYMATAYLTRWGGPVNEAEDVYGDSYTPSGLAPRKHVQEMLYIPGGAGGAAGTSGIKSAVMRFGAVGTALYWADAAYDEGQSSYYHSGSEPINHGVAIVGWDDDFAASRFASVPPADGAWLVRNSWGTGFGDGGYFWVSYHDAHCGRDNVFNAVYNNAERVTNYNSIYSHDPLGQVDVLGVGGTTAWGANVFTASKGQAIAAVGFYTHVPGTTYTVYAGRVAADGRPGPMTARGSGTINAAGFHTVRFTSTRWTAAGARFAVAVKLTTPGSNYPFAYETRLADFSSRASARAGQSFVRASSSDTWYDLTEYDPNANICLKAYALNDTKSPSTRATSARVKRYAKVALKFRVSDAAPSCGAARVKLQFLKGGRVVKAITVPGTKRVNVTANHTWKATLGKGTYSWRVAATDLAGHTATTRLAAKLVIY